MVMKQIKQNENNRNVMGISLLLLRILKQVRNDNVEESCIYADALHKKDKRICEIGRSMTEMLGVLAIIGVLSVGAIGGYSYAMDKYRANQTMQDINLRAIDVIAQYNRMGDVVQNAWKNEKTIYPIMLEDETFGIQVSDVPERVCEMIAEGMAHTATAIKINAEYMGENVGECGDQNTMVFYFDEENNKGCNDDGIISKCVTEDGQTGYCIMGACHPDGTQTCISETGSVENCPYDPACFVVEDGLTTFISGLPCEKDGKKGICSGGICQTKNTLCGGIDCAALATENGLSPLCVGCQNEQCIALVGSICIIEDNKIGACWLDGTCANSCTTHDACGKGQFCLGLSASGPGFCQALPPYRTETITFTDENGIERTENWYFPENRFINDNWFINKDICDGYGWRMGNADDFYSQWDYDPSTEEIQNNRGKVFSPNWVWLENTPPDKPGERLKNGGFYVTPYDAITTEGINFLCTDK